MGGMPNGPNGPGTLGVLGSLLGGGAQKKATDGFFTDRVPVLQKLKRPVLVGFFLYCFWQGWIGRWGLLQGLMSGSYFDMLAVPLRVVPNSPLYDRPFFVAQIWVDSGARLLGFLINLARGKAKIPSVSDFLPRPQPPDSTAPWGMPGTAVSGSGTLLDPTVMPTAPTAATPPPSSGGPNRTAPGAKPPTIIDAEVRFLD